MRQAWEDVDVLANDEVVAQATFSWNFGYQGIVRIWSGVLTLVPGDATRAPDLTGKSLIIRDRGTGRTVKANAEQRPMGQGRQHVSITGHGPPPDIS